MSISYSYTDMKPVFPCAFLSQRPAPWFLHPQLKNEGGILPNLHSQMSQIYFSILDSQVTALFKTSHSCFLHCFPNESIFLKNQTNRVFSLVPKPCVSFTSCKCSDFSKEKKKERKKKKKKISPSYLAQFPLQVRAGRVTAPGDLELDNSM